jgi:hypothetical protein
LQRYGAEIAGNGDRVADIDAEFGGEILKTSAPV